LVAQVNGGCGDGPHTAPVYTTPSHGPWPPPHRPAYPGRVTVWRRRRGGRCASRRKSP